MSDVEAGIWGIYYEKRKKQQDAENQAAKARAGAGKRPRRR